MVAPRNSFDFYALVFQGIQGLAGTNGTNGTNGLDGNGIASTTDNGDGTFTFTYDDGSTFTTSDLTGPAGSQDAWSLTGNTGTDPATNFIGTTDAQDLSVKTNDIERVKILSSGEVGIGATPDASAKLDVSSTTQGFLPPRLTIAERDAIASPAVGLVIYNTTTNCLNFYIGSGWNETCGTASLPLGTITALDCGSATNNGTLTEGEPASGVSSEISYTGGNGGTHNGQTVNSTGVTGLTATLNAGTFANGAGTLSYIISGTPSASGNANFALNIGGQSCTLAVVVDELNLAAQYPAGSVFCASGPTAIVEVTNPTTGRVWLDRNLGATQAATSSTDAAAYGDLYQWGRRSDGHQCRNSPTTSTLSSTDQPAHGDFILTSSTPNDWRSPQNTNLWQGVNGVNNPCPSGYRVPTETEWNSERLTWNSNNPAGAFASQLKITLAGGRGGGGGIFGVTTNIHYWSSSIDANRSRELLSTGTIVGMNSVSRSQGNTVRCIKN